MPVEVRSENDYGPAKERDPVAETVTAYTAADPLTGKVFRRGDTADAEPAVPGWRLLVDALFA